MRVVSNPAETATELVLAMNRLRGRLRSETRAETGPWTGSQLAAMYGSWTRSQLAALYRVVSGPPSTTSDLAAAEYMRPQSMAQTLTGLESDGLITRGQDPTDGRRILISATDRGRDVARWLTSTREQWLAGAIEHGLDERSRAALPDLIQLLNRLADCDAPRLAPRIGRPE
jgi:DNA-binding MarR family transcriptional regulator